MLFRNFFVPYTLHMCSFMVVMPRVTIHNVNGHGNGRKTVASEACGQTFDCSCQMYIIRGLHVLRQMTLWLEFDAIHYGGGWGAGGRKKKERKRKPRGGPEHEQQRCGVSVCPKRRPSHTLHSRYVSLSSLNQQEVGGQIKSISSSCHWPASCQEEGCVF